MQYTIFILLLIIEILEKKRRQHNIYMSNFLHDSNAYFHKGQLISHKNKKRFLTKDELFLFLYVDDGPSIFSTRREAILGTEIGFEQIKRLRLNMRTGDGENLLKLKLFSSHLDRKSNPG